MKAIELARQLLCFPDADVGALVGTDDECHESYRMVESVDASSEYGVAILVLKEKVTEQAPCTDSD